MSANPQALHRGFVKQVLSGDSIVVRGQPKGGPPPERTVGLSNIIAPRIARRPTGTLEESKDEPFAWEAREFLRKKLIGKTVVFTVEYKVPGTGKEFGVVYNGSNAEAENVTESLVAEGLVEIRRQGLKASDEQSQKLLALEEAAKGQGKGKWAAQEVLNQHIRSVCWNVENPRRLVDSMHQKPIDAVIEHVRDGCTVRAFLLPSFTYVTVMLSGVKCPMFRIVGDETAPEAMAEEAKYFTESRLLQRDVQIILEGVSSQNLIGSIVHPNGNIAEFLLKEGFARCVDWSISLVSTGPEAYREAEKSAKEKRIRLWKDFTPSASNVTSGEKSYTATVVEIINGDGLMIKTGDGKMKKIFLASVRPPRPSGTQAPDSTGKKAEAPVKKTETAGGRRGGGNARPRPLYDVPYMFDAREFLRKKLIGQKVQVTVDYMQPANNDMPERACCTVIISNTNVAEALVTRGFGTVVRYRQDDDRRSSSYDTLLSAEARAEKKGVGVHSKKEPTMIRVADVSGDLTRAKQFLPFLQRAGRSTGLVEYVASGSRLRLYIPKETCLITFLLSGIQCPRGSRPDPANPGKMLPAEECGEEATTYTKEMVLQREVEVEVEAMDKGGNFIGWLFFEGTNVSQGLVERGLSKVHFTAERSAYFSALSDAERRAQEQKLGIWVNYVPPVPSEDGPEGDEQVDETAAPGDRKTQFKSVVVTEAGPGLKFYAQDVENGPQLEKLMEELHTEMQANPPLPGAYTPKRGDLCCAKFSDGQWYRAKVEKVDGKNVSLFYIDFGNRENSDTSKITTLPPSYKSSPGYAKEYTLALCQMPPDEEDQNLSQNVFKSELLDRQLQLNVEYRGDGGEYATVLDSEKEDIGQSLVAEGWLLYEHKKDRRLAKLVNKYADAQEKAKKARLNLWQYGDFTADDAREFGMGVSR